MDEDILISAMFFLTVIILTIGIPLVRAHIRHRDRQTLPPASDAQINNRLERIEQAIDAVAVEVERISEGQRFTTKLLSDRGRENAPLLPPSHAP